MMSSIMWLSVIELKMPKAQLRDQARASVFIYQGAHLVLSQRYFPKKFATYAI